MHHSNSRLRLLAFAGSLRRESWNHRLLRAAAESSADAVVVDLFEDLGSIPLFDEDLEVDDPLAVRSLRRRVEVADGVLIATPEYNQSIPGVLKNAIDWLSRPYGESCLIGKAVAVLGASTGAWGTRIAQKELRHVLWAAESLVLPGPPVYVRNVADLFDEEGRLTDEKTRKALDGLLTAFADWIRAAETRAEEALDGGGG